MRPVFANDEVKMRQRVAVEYRKGWLPVFHDALMRNPALRAVFTDK